jgi:hypothetical protein
MFRARLTNHKGASQQLPNPGDNEAALAEQIRRSSGVPRGPAPAVSNNVNRYYFVYSTNVQQKGMRKISVHCPLTMVRMAVRGIMI